MGKAVWIRTQDRKRLMLVDKLETVSGSIYANGSYNCGDYDDEASAMRVLDYIQAKIQDRVTLVDDGSIKVLTENIIVAEMPKIAPPSIKKK